VELIGVADLSVGAEGGEVSFTAVTVTVVEDDVLPELLVAVSVYVVDWAGDTEVDAAPETLPIPGAMVTEVAPVTFQERVAACPAAILEGDAVNEAIAGAEVVPEIGRAHV
jgi:hypothetical protein